MMIIIIIIIPAYKNSFCTYCYCSQIYVKMLPSVKIKYLYRQNRFVRNASTEPRDLKVFSHNAATSITKYQES